MADTSEWGTQRPILTAKFDRPTEGGLFVKCANGDEWPAGVEDLRRFKFVEAMYVYSQFKAMMEHRMPGWESVAEGALCVVRQVLYDVIFSDGVTTDERDFDALKRIMGGAEGWA